MQSPFSIITWHQLLPSSKLEDGPIEERDGYEHVPGGQVVHCSEGAPKWSLEPKPSRARGCVEIRHIIPGKTIAKFWVGKHLKSSSLPAQRRKLLVLSALTAMETQSAKMMRNREDINSFHTCRGGNMTLS